MRQRHLTRVASSPSTTSTVVQSRPGAPPEAGKLGRYRFLLLLTWLVTPLLLLLLGAYSNLDLKLADLMFDPIAGQFPWRHAWLTETFGHRILKAGLIACGVLIILLCGWDMKYPIAGPWFRLRLRTVGASAIAVPAIISVLKRFSASHCPWDLQRYGGTEPYYRLLEALPHGVTSGHCFPAGHASSALWLAAIGLFWWPRRPRVALTVCSAMLMVGFVVGWMQQMRGAHFLSHTLWSMWIAGTIIIAAYMGLNAWEGKRLPQKLATEDTEITE